jgi:hypothetical protein
MLPASAQIGIKGGLEYIKGYTWAHHKYMNAITGRNITGYQADLIFDLQKSGYEWAGAYNYPETGILFNYLDLNEPVLGKIYSSIFYYTFYLNPRKNKLHFLLQFGEGLAYNTNPYDKIKNPKNIVFGSHILYGFYFGFKVQTRFGRGPLFIETGVSAYHYSNGSFKTPNAGLNIPTFNITLIYDDVKPATDSSDVSLPPFERKKYYSFFVRGTYNEADLPGIGIRPGYIAGMEKIWYTSYKHAYAAGMEIMWNFSLKEYLYYENIAYRKYGDHIPDYRRIGLYAGHLFRFGNTSFITAAGVYLYNPSGKERPWYIRAGLRYKIHKRFLLSATVKTHYFMVEEVDFGIHYLFKKPGK